MQSSRDDRVEQYKSAVKLMSYDGSIMWRIMQAFLLPQGIILTYVLTTPVIRLTAEEPSGFLGWNPDIFFIALFCFVLCIPWFLVCSRSIASYNFSVRNARHLEPHGWKVIGGKRTLYFNGKEVDIKDGLGPLKLKWHSKMRIKNTSYIIIGAFALTFIALVVSSLPLSKIADILKETRMIDAWLIVVIVGTICGVLVIRMEYLKQMAVIRKRNDLVNPSRVGLLIGGLVLVGIGLSFLVTQLITQLETWLYLPGFFFFFMGIALVIGHFVVGRSKKKS